MDVTVDELNKLSSMLLPFDVSIPEVLEPLLFCILCGNCCSYDCVFNCSKSCTNRCVSDCSYECHSNCSYICSSDEQN